VSHIVRATTTGLFLLTAGSPPPAAADGEACPPAPQETVRVAAVLDGDTLALEDGRTVRLVSVLAPKPHGGEPEAGDGTADTADLPETARKALETAVVGRDLGLAYTGERQDRHGRLLAHGLVPGAREPWLQAHLVDRGLARVYAVEDNYRCVARLIDREAVARTKKRGLWSRRSGAILSADRPEEVRRETGRFAIVEGVVKTVGDRPRRTYLNFGKNWSQDFTVFVDRGDTARFEHAEIDLTGLAGRRVRVRGWIRDDRGPALKMTVPEQLELVGTR